VKLVAIKKNREKGRDVMCSGRMDSKRKADSGSRAKPELHVANEGGTGGKNRGDDLREGDSPEEKST